MIPPRKTYFQIEPIDPPSSLPAGSVYHPIIKVTNLTDKPHTLTGIMVYTRNWNGDSTLTPPSYVPNIGVGPHESKTITLPTPVHVPTDMFAFQIVISANTGEVLMGGTWGPLSTSVMLNINIEGASLPTPSTPPEIHPPQVKPENKPQPHLPSSSPTHPKPKNNTTTPTTSHKWDFLILIGIILIGIILYRNL